VGWWVGGELFIHIHALSHTHAAAAGVSRASACVDQ